MTRNILILVTTALLFFMIWEIVDTSLESNLFLELPQLVKIPWLEATLYDFYTNVLFIFLWISYKEKNQAKKIIWLILLLLLGSVTTCIYVLKELFQLSDNDKINALITRKNG